MTGALRAVVADDSQFMRTVIADALEAGGIEVVGEASDGQTATDLVCEYRPDVVTMDVQMPGVDGLEAVARIMDRCPTPILMLSAHTGENADVTFDALDRGAVDFMRKPGGEVSMELSTLQEDLVDAVRSVAAADVTGDRAAQTDAQSATGTTSGGTAASAQSATAGVAGESISAPTGEGTTPATAAVEPVEGDPLVVIGASTGGPPVVERVLAALPPEAGLRVLVVQHMPEGFTGRFAARLDDASGYDVREATDGAVLRAGEVLVAPGDSHLTVADVADGDVTVTLSDAPPEHGVRPAVDVTLRSVAANAATPLVAAILTGMGQDGAAGVDAVVDAGGVAVAQDESTSAVYGMPQRAVETGAVSAIRPAEEIPAAVTAAARGELS